MAGISFGDLAQPFQLQRQNADLKATLQRLTTEMTSGQTTDPGKALGGDFSQLAGLESSLTALTAYASSASLAATYAAMQQQSLQEINSAADSLAPTLLQASAASGGSQLTTLAAQGKDALGAALSALNVRAGNRGVFSGAAADQPAVASADTILAALQAAVAGQTTTAGVAQAVKDWFTSPTGYAAVGYTGSASPASAIPITQGQTASVATSALDPAIVDTLTGFALAAMIDTGGISGNRQAQADLAAQAGQALMSASTGRADLGARIGVVQARITAAQTQNSSEQKTLATQRSTLLGVDPYKTATDLQLTQTQIETLYALTARISQLSLANYIK